MRTQQCEETFTAVVVTRTAPGSPLVQTGVFVDARVAAFAGQTTRVLSCGPTSAAPDDDQNLCGADGHVRPIESRTPQKRVCGAGGQGTKTWPSWGRRAERVLDNSHRAIVSDAAVRLPDAFMYWCELLQRIAPLPDDWESLVGNLTAIATGVELVIADGRDPDWRAVERVMRDSIPFVTVEILKQTALKRSEGIQAYQRFRKYGYRARTDWPRRK